MDLKPNKTHIKIIKEGAFGGTYFRDIYSGINDKFCKNSGKEFKELENIDKKYYSSDFYDVNLYKHKTRCGTSLRFWESKSWINKQDPYGWFQWYFRYYLGRRSKNDQRQINRGKKLLLDLRVLYLK